MTNVERKYSDRRRVVFSPSLPKLKLSKPEHTFTSRLLAKKPEPSPAVWAMPISRKSFGVSRALGLGLRSRLKGENKTLGIKAREAAVGGG